MKIGGAKFDINGIRCTADGAENQVFSLTVLIFGIQSLSIVRHLWTDISSALRDITPEVTVSDMKTMETVETVSRAISQILCAIDEQLELKDARGEGPTIN